MNRKALFVITAGAFGLGLAIWAFFVGLWLGGGETHVIQIPPTAQAIAKAVEVRQANDADMQRAADDFDKRHPPLAIPAVFAQSVQFDVGITEASPKGDRLTITEVRGTDSVIKPGNVYQIKGHYTLSSHDQASLDVYVTSKRAEDGLGRPQPCQGITVNRGENDFTLVLPMRCEGWPHVSMYADGKNAASVYFGTGESVLQHW